MSDIKETISTLNNLLRGAKSSKELVAYVKEFDCPSHFAAEKLRTIKKIEVSLLKELINRAESKAREEQLYYVLDPIGKSLLYTLETNAGRVWTFGFVPNDWKKKAQKSFTKSELTDIQEQFPGLNIDLLKVPVEDYDNANSK